MGFYRVLAQQPRRLRLVLVAVGDHWDARSLKYSQNSIRHRKKQ